MAWQLPDLAWRIRGVNLAMIDGPDDRLLHALLHKKFAERQLYAGECNPLSCRPHGTFFLLLMMLSSEWIVFHWQTEATLHCPWQDLSWNRVRLIFGRRNCRNRCFEAGLQINQPDFLFSMAMAMLPFFSCRAGVPKISRRHPSSARMGALSSSANASRSSADAIRRVRCHDSQ